MTRGAAPTGSRATDAAPWLPLDERPRKVRSQRRSLHLTMRDGVRIAVDVHLPPDYQGKLPTVIRQTRYFRSVKFREPFARLPLEWLVNSSALTRERFLANGYAWVDVCARGSGASFGSRPCPWSPDEVADGAEVVSWIVEQSWSNGRVGATGISYDGTTSEMLAVNKHPAVKAVVPRFSSYDVFADVAFPGGIHLSGFTSKWASFNRDLDSNSLDRAFATMIRVQVRAMRELHQSGVKARALALADSSMGEALSAFGLRVLSSGVRPVDEDGSALLDGAVASHAANMDVHEGALGIDNRDDVGAAPGLPDSDIDVFSPHAYADELRNSGTAIYGYSGWLDGAYQNSAIKRFTSIRTSGSRLIVGPWDHGGRQHVSPFCDAPLSAFDHGGELLAFFDHHLRNRDNAAASAPRVRYFTMGEERWHSAEDWPPPCVEQHWYIGPERSLSLDAPTRTGADEYEVDCNVGTGKRARWMSLLGLLPPVGYNDRREVGEKLLVYRSQPLPAALTFTGHPRLQLTLTSTHEDAFVFAYLEAERPDGSVVYITEGQLRACHRHHVLGEDGRIQRGYKKAHAKPLVPGEATELVVELLPTSWRMPQGWRLRVSLAGADRDYFELPKSGAKWAVHFGEGSQVPCLVLPVIEA